MTPAGTRVLLVEDESLVAMLVEDLLQELGCVVVGNPGTLAEALSAIPAGGFDVALLDINLAGERVAPVAQALADAEIPFVFASGYGRSGVPPQFRDAPLLVKPFDIRELERALAAALHPAAPRAQVARDG